MAEKRFRTVYRKGYDLGPGSYYVVDTKKESEGYRDGEEGAMEKN